MNRPPSHRTIAAACLLGALSAGCLSQAASDDLAPPQAPAWALEKSGYTAAWDLAGYPAGFCRDGVARSPRIVNIIESPDPHTGKIRLAASILGCDATKPNFRGLIVGTLEPLPGEPSTLNIRGWSIARASLADGTVADADDFDTLIAIDFIERDTSCLATSPDGATYTESATRDVTLRAPMPTNETAALMGQVYPSTLRGTRSVGGCD